MYVICNTVEYYAREHTTGIQAQIKKSDPVGVNGEAEARTVQELLPASQAMVVMVDTQATLLCNMMHFFRPRAQGLESETGTGRKSILAHCSIYDQYAQRYS